MQTGSVSDPTPSRLRLVRRHSAAAVLATHEPFAPAMDTTPEHDSAELKVHFFPELFLQRRIWILNILRKEGVREVLDVGCGEGQLLGTLCRPAPWLRPPPAEVLPPTPTPTPIDGPVPPSPVFNEDEVPNLHIQTVYGLDVSSADLKFALEGTAPPVEIPDEAESPGFRSYVSGVQRWEELVAKIWHGGLEAINEEFVGLECIVSTEVIEHLPEDIFPAFAPMLLGVYHPSLLLITTPSYTYNARFTAPDAPPSARNGFPDPTGRTDRVFRHDDHKFEWTREEFVAWCEATAAEWGYVVEQTSIGRSVNADPYGRDDELEGASNVAAFRKAGTTDDAARAAKGRAYIQQLGLRSASHTLLAVQQHAAHPASMRPRPLPEIAACVKAKMEEFREAFMRVEELWYEKEIAVMCGGWIELLVRAIEESSDLNLKREPDPLGKKTANWSVELIGGVVDSQKVWLDDNERESSVDYIPEDWTPGEGPYEAWDDTSDRESNGVEGDVSEYTSEADGEDESDTGTSVGWGVQPKKDWHEMLDDPAAHVDAITWGRKGDWGDTEATWDGVKVPEAALSSSAGWDGDESCETTS